MKNLMKTGFLIIILQIANNISAQPYKSIFGKVSTQWYYYTLYWGNQLREVEKDTIINGTLYKMLNNHTYLSEDTLTGYVSINTSSGILHGYPAMPVCLMNLQQGDTLPMVSYGYPIVVDSVYQDNGLKIISTNENMIGPVPGTTYELDFIEGIGSRYGIDVYYIGDEQIYTIQILLCVFKDGVKVYQCPDSIYQGNCEYYGLGENKPEARPMVYPNPAHDDVNVFLPPGVNSGSLMLFDEKLMIIRELNISSNVTSISMSDLKPGLYFLRIMISDELYYHKIIKM